jgi:hypothetical protein
MSPTQITYETWLFWLPGRHCASDMGNPRFGSDAGRWGARGHDLAPQGTSRGSPPAPTDPARQEGSTSRVAHATLERNSPKCEYWYVIILWRLWRRFSITNSSVFWDIRPWSPFKVNVRFGRTWRLQLQGWRLSQARNQRKTRWQADTYLLLCWSVFSICDISVAPPICSFRWEGVIILADIFIVYAFAC